MTGMSKKNKLSTEVLEGRMEMIRARHQLVILSQRDSEGDGEESQFSEPFEMHGEDDRMGLSEMLSAAAF